MRVLKTAFEAIEVAKQNGEKSVAIPVSQPYDVNVLRDTMMLFPQCIMVPTFPDSDKEHICAVMKDASDRSTAEDFVIVFLVECLTDADGAKLAADLGMNKSAAA
jgi:hypothetical protein